MHTTVEALSLLVFGLTIWFGHRQELATRHRIEGVVRHWVIYDDYTLENPDWQAIRVRGVRAVKLVTADGRCYMLGGQRWYYRQGNTYGCVHDLSLLNKMDVELLSGDRSYNMTVRG